MMVKIFIFRHGQTTYNKQERFTGWLNPPLTSLGKKQARKIANLLKKKEIKIAFKTTLLRSSQTLNEVLKFHPECKVIITDNRIIERNYGLLNGETHKEFIKDIGNKLLRLNVEGDAYENLSKENRKKLSTMLGEEEYKLIHRGYATPPPKGESFKQVESRVSSFIKDLKKLAKKQKCNIAISAHGNSIRMFRKIMEKATVNETCSWIIPYDKVFTYSIKV